MDGLSAAGVARDLGTNVPRVLRAAQRLGLQPRRVGNGRGTRVFFTPAEVWQLGNELGYQGSSTLSRAQAQVLAALVRSGRGVVSARALARRAAVSPTTASRALVELEHLGLVTRETKRVALGKAREIEIIRANTSAPGWETVGEELARVRPPTKHGPTRRARRVPNELKHLFWNVAARQLDVDRAGGYIARRLIQTGDLDGLAWGAENLSAEDWRHAAATRGLDAPLRALALNLAGANE